MLIDLSVCMQQALSVQDLKEGDVLVVRGFNPVSISQSVTQFLGSPISRKGSASSIHVMLVTGVYSDYALVAHLVRSGACVDYIRNPTVTTPASGAPASSADTASTSTPEQPAVTYTSAVYRIGVPKYASAGCALV